MFTRAYKNQNSLEKPNPFELFNLILNILYYYPTIILIVSKKVKITKEVYYQWRQSNFEQFSF